MSLAALESARPNAARPAALAALLEAGLPGRKSERWKYTKAAPFADFAVAALTAPREAPSSPAAGQLDIDAVLAPYGDCGVLAFIDGRLDPAMTRLPVGIQLADAGARAPGNGAGADDALWLLNAALPSADLELTVADGAEIAGGLHVVHRVTGAGALGQVRLAIDVGRGARLTLVEHFDDPAAGEYMHNTVLTARVGEDAALHLRRLQALGDDALQATRIDAEVSANGALDTLTLDAGGRIVRNDLNVRLTGPGARVDMRGVYLGDGSQHIDNHTHVDHVARDTISREDYRGILRDRSRGVFNGKVHVHEGADGTDAAQSNPNLLLSDHAEIDTKPELEIYADDVKCSHGATVGQIDATSLFYLRSRGIDQATAVQLLTWAFCREALTGIADDALRTRAERLVAEQIPDFSALELIA